MKSDLISQAFHPVEAAIVRIAIGWPAERGDSKLDLWNRGKNLPSGVVHLEPGFNENKRSRSASDALARLVLFGIEDTLPVFAVPDRGVASATRKTRAVRSQPVRAMPHFLLEVNWADSAPGISWPEAYHVGWLPGFGCWVLTASRNTPEVDGYCDRVLGHFDHCDDPIAEARKRLQAYWQELKGSYGQQRWAYLFNTGRITRHDAEQMAGVVWPVIADKQDASKEVGV